jgi:Pyruvate/2-oxoacid:ferredoxin oxidoreductase gamma subunit
VDGEAIVRTVGVARALNFAMLGAAAGLGVLPFGDENLLSAISRRSSAGALAANRLAFSLGREAVKA